MKILIDIPEETIRKIKNELYCGIDDPDLYKAMEDGKLLPKGHGRLIDADALIKSIEKKAGRLTNLDTINGLCGAINLIYAAKSIIEADKEDEE